MSRKTVNRHRPPAWNDLPDRLTVAQVASYLRIARNTVIGLVQASKLAAVDLAGAGAKRSYYRIRKIDLAAFIAERRS